MLSIEEIDNLFKESNAFIEKIEVKFVPGKSIGSEKFPTASFVSSGFCILVMHTSNGLTGVGEPSPYGGNVNNTMNAAIQIGKELKDAPLYKAWTYSAIDPKLFNTGYGELAKQAVVAAISQCCIDVIGKELNKPVFKLLDPKSNGIVETYASGGMIHSNQSLNYYVEEAMKSKENGYMSWKFRPSTPRNLDHFQRNLSPPQIDLRAIKTTIINVAKECGDDFEILLDAGCRCKDIDEALELCNFSSSYNVGFIEEPLIRDVKQYSVLRSNTKMKISSGETFFSSNQLLDWVSNRAIDIVQPDSNLMSIREVIKTFEIAKKNNIKIVFHNWANAISNISNISLASCMPSVCNYVESSIVHNPHRNELIEEPVKPILGKYKLYDKPGLNVDLIL
tara:strand:+ start:21479 stop:22657 length:1179 start_codon:yes stop_codon:yes gene_type:complete